MSRLIGMRMDWQRFAFGMAMMDPFIECSIITRIKRKEKNDTEFPKRRRRRRERICRLSAWNNGVNLVAYDFTA
jgi:hypothetical protein